MQVLGCPNVQIPPGMEKIIHTIEVGDLMGVGYRTCVLMIVWHVNMCAR